MPDQPVPTPPAVRLDGLATRATSLPLSVVLGQVGARVPATPRGPRVALAADDSSSIGASGVGAPAAVTPIAEVPTDAPRALLSAGRVSGGQWAGLAAHRASNPSYDVIRAESVNAAPVAATTMPAADWSVWVLTESDLADPVVPFIWDLTGGSWPEMCNDRHGFKGAHPGVIVRRTCTRRAKHLGRHAAAAGGRIVAVWGVKHDPAAVVPLEVTA